MEIQPANIQISLLVPCYSLKEPIYLVNNWDLVLWS